MQQCAACHGEFGESAGRWPILMGGAGTLTGHDPVKSIGSYWPYASTVIDYIRRAMPFGNSQSLSNDELYAVTAYVCYLNDIIKDENFELNEKTFKTIKLPNEPNFYDDDRETAEKAFWRKEPCMSELPSRQGQDHRPRQRSRCHAGTRQRAKGGMMNATPNISSSRRTAFGAIAAGLSMLSPAAWAETKSHRLALQISDNSPDKMNAVLNVAANVSRYYSDKGEEVEIEIVAFNAGMHMLRSDTSPVKERMTSFRKSMTNVSFKACGNTMAAMERNEGHKVVLLPDIDVVDAGVTRLIELSEKGWTIVRP